MARRSIKIGPFTLGASQSLADVKPIPLEPNGRLSLHCIIDGGSAGQVPTDAPQGSWRLYFSGDDSAPFAPAIAAASTGEASLASIAPNGNALVNAYASFEGVPLARAKIVYERTSGGAASRATLYVTVD